jgi:hypothetical protein
MKWAEGLKISLFASIHPGNEPKPAGKNTMLAQHVY